MANTLGARIAGHRKRLGITQEQLAEAMGVSFQAVSKWENDLSCPDITLLPQLSDYFHVSVDELLRGDQGSTVQMTEPHGPVDLNKRILRIIVDEPDGDRVRVNLPLSLVKVGLEIGLSMPEVTTNENLRNIDFEAILKAVDMGVTGNIVEVSTDKGENVKIYID